MSRVRLLKSCDPHQMRLIRRCFLYPEIRRWVAVATSTDMYTAISQQATLAKPEDWQRSDQSSCSGSSETL